MRFLYLLMLFIVTLNANAFELKNKPVQVIIPFGPGGGTDTVFRKLQKYGEDRNVFLQPIYRPGAQGLIGMQMLHESEPNGLTAGVITFDTITLWHNKSPVDVNNIIPIQKNIFGIVTTKVGSLTDIVKNSSNQKPLKIGYLLASQKQIVELIMMAYGIKFEQIYVPYKSGSELIQNLISGDIDIGITSLNVLAPLIKSGKMRLLAIDANQIKFEFSDAMLLNKLDPKISSINKGSSIVLPPNSSKEVIKFWKDFIELYLNDASVKQDSSINYWEPVRKTVKELEKDLAEDKKIFK